MSGKQAGDYPPGCTQHHHDAAFDRMPASDRVIDERAKELAREDFDNWSDEALDWLTNYALDTNVDYVIDVVREAVRYMARPELGLYSKGQLDDAVSELRALYVYAHADRFRQQAIDELADYYGSDE